MGDFSVGTFWFLRLHNYRGCTSDPKWYDSGQVLKLSDVQNGHFLAKNESLVTNFVVCVFRDKVQCSSVAKLSSLL